MYMAANKRRFISLTKIRGYHVDVLNLKDKLDPQEHATAHTLLAQAESKIRAEIVRSDSAPIQVHIRKRVLVSVCTILETAGDVDGPLKAMHDYERLLENLKAEL